LIEDLSGELPQALPLLGIKFAEVAEGGGQGFLELFVERFSQGSANKKGMD
jgi:hypothetical protein